MRIAKFSLKQTAALLFCLNAFATLPGYSAETPEKVVSNYYLALAKAGKLQDLKAFESERCFLKQAEFEGKMPPNRTSEFVSFMKFGHPKSIKITTAEIKGERANVLVQALNTTPLQAPPPQKDPHVSLPVQTVGMYYLVRENGLWKIDGEDWRTDKSELKTVNPNDWQEWVNQISQMELAKVPKKLTAKIAGKSIELNYCEVGPNQFFGGTWLKFSDSADSPKYSLSLSLDSDKTSVAGKSFNILAKKMSWTRKGMFNAIIESPLFPAGSMTQAGPGGCCMKLSFEPGGSDQIKGRILIRLTTQPETSLAGEFVAKIKK